jgi:lipopolysaccharide export system protein LptC
VQRKNLIKITLLLLLLAGGAGRLLQQDEKTDSEQEVAEHTPDYFLRDFTITTMGPDGRPEQRLTAELMQHYPDDDTTDLTHPNILLYDKDNPPWEVRSETGWLSGDGELLVLQGMVTIDRAAGPNNRPLHLITRDLQVRPKENYAETDQKVTIRSLHDQQESDGMQAWFRKPIRLRFAPNVRGRYEIN